jgi:hypothetical protein
MSVNIDQVLRRNCSQQNPTVLNAAVMSNEIVLNRFAKLIPRIRGVCSVNSVMGHVVQAFALHGLKLQMYSLEEAVEKLPKKSCLLLQPKFLVLGQKIR